MINILGVSKKFGDITAVDNIKLTIEGGEIFGVVGPDGAGKSTLLRIISTIMKPDEGTLTYQNRNIFENIYQYKEKLAYMPQRFGLYEDLSVEENIFFFGRLFGVSRKGIRERLPQLYDFSRLGPFKDRLAGKLSGGMKQKLGLACCLVHRPELLLLDEPTNGVDPVSRREFWEILYDLLGEGVTIIVSTAYLDEAERCNRIALMYNGRFIRIDNPKNVKLSTGKKLLYLETGDSRKAEFVLSSTLGYSGVMRTGNAVRIFTDNLRKTGKQIKSAMQKNKISLKILKEATPGLEDSFMEIISQEENK